MKKLILIFLLTISICLVSYSQSQLTQNFSFKIKKDGSADVELQMKMNAQQWAQFKATTNASNLAVRKRDMERMRETFFIQSSVFCFNKNINFKDATPVIL